jgi:hypothetical protein
MDPGWRRPLWCARLLVLPTRVVTRGTVPAFGNSLAYKRHRPEEAVLYGAVQSQLESFLAREATGPLIDGASSWAR